MKFKVGDYAEIVRDINGHGYRVGEVVRIVECFPNDIDPHYEVESTTRNFDRYVEDREIIPLASLKDIILERPDLVNHPKHYKTESGLEAIDVMEAFNLHRDGRLFNASKYILRAGKKGKESQDIRKAIWYLERYADALEVQDA